MADPIPVKLDPLPDIVGGDGAMDAIARGFAGRNQSLVERHAVALGNLGKDSSSSKVLIDYQLASNTMNASIAATSSALDGISKINQQVLQKLS